MKKYLRLLGSAALIALLLWRIDFGEVTTTLARVRWGWWVVAVALYGVAQAVSAGRWRLLGRPLGFEEPTSRLLAYTFIGNFFNLVLPTSVGGDVVRVWYLDGRSGRRWTALLSVLADRLTGLGVLIAMACASAFCVELPDWVRWWVFAAGFAALAGLAVLPLVKRQSLRLVRKAGGGRVRRLLGQVAEMMDLYKKRPGMLAAVAGLSLAVQVLNVVLVWLLTLGLDLSVPIGYFFAAVPLVSLLTMAPISVNGMGVREAGLVVLLAPLGVVAGQAVTLSLLWFGVFLAAGAAGAACYLLGSFPRYEVRTDESVGSDSDQGRTRQSATAA